MRTYQTVTLALGLFFLPSPLVAGVQGGNAAQQQQQGPPSQQPGNNRGQQPPRQQPPQNRPNRPAPSPKPNPNPPRRNPSRPPGRPNTPPPRPSPGRPPNVGRPGYSFRPSDRDRIRRYYGRNLGYINRSRRPNLIIGGYIPLGDRRYFTPVPGPLLGYLPPPPPGYVVGYFDGYCVVYDPVTFTILSFVDLLG
jgi:hypothetical protein